MGARGDFPRLEPMALWHSFPVGSFWPRLPPFDDFPSSSMYSYWIKLEETISPDDLGALIGQWGRERGRFAEDALSAIEMLVRQMRSPEDRIQVVGGLQFSFEEEIIFPGKNVFLEEWREVVGFAIARGGPSPWLGYEDPPIVLERQDSAARLRDLDTGKIFLEFPFAHLPEMLAEVQRDLLGFLRALRLWCGCVAPDLADEFVDLFDKALHISEPLGL